MPTPRTTIWELDEHSRGKHIVLERYLKAWLPILGTTQERIVFIDGFAGPGEYTGGEKGSPIIALEALVEHKAPITAKVHFLFIEADPRRAQHLEQLVAPLAQRLLGRATIEVKTGTFDSELSGLLNEIESRKMLLAPSFVMADPFGVSHTPMSVMSQILKNPSSEVYVSFMAEFINRFKDTELYPVS
ncbi:MAG: three-Cys-motif partner protein TcmP [Gemmatimonadaceae bacterium]|nr:three-Cys-motif partner protein TcmP [Gemmatimonadaceae bacterium]